MEGEEIEMECFEDDDDDDVTGTLVGTSIIVIIIIFKALHFKSCTLLLFHFLSLFSIKLSPDHFTTQISNEVAWRVRWNTSLMTTSSSVHAGIYPLSN